MNKFIDCLIPIDHCNLKCEYCFVEQRPMNQQNARNEKYSPEFIGLALSKNRLGGVCHFNISAEGETLIAPDIVSVLYQILAQGHYVMVVTNGTISKRFKEIIKLPKEYLSRLGFKFSFHYLELIRNNILETFIDNVHLMDSNGVSTTIELMPHDELVPHIKDIKNICEAKFGALCHVSVGRNEELRSMPLLTKYSRAEYSDIWSEFDSDLFRFKLSTFNVKRTEYCYAGKWSGFVNLGTGEFMPCHGGEITQNIYEDVNKPIKFIAIGRKCLTPHCINSHAWLTCGLIPGMDGAPPYYDQVRDRKRKDGRSWLNEGMKINMRAKMYEENMISSMAEQYSDRLWYFYLTKLGKVKRRLFQ